jgi:carnitine O-acetyltransferase
MDSSYDGYSESMDEYSEGALSSPVGSPSKHSDHSSGVELKPSRDRGNSTNSRSQNDQRLPLLFADSGWDKLNTTVLSTSNCGNPSLRHFGFGPASGDGFGIGYIIKDESISVCVSSKHRQTRRFIDTLESYLLEIRRILRITNQKSAVKSSRARECEDVRPKPINRLKSRGRLITGADSVKPSPRANTGATSPTDESTTISDDELGGCKSSHQLTVSRMDHQLIFAMYRWLL